MAMNLLSARKVETILPQAEPYWLKDGGSLFLYVTPNGSKLWRYRYRLGGKPAIYAIGKYPAVSLEAARNERDRARELVKKGVHPVVEKRISISTQLEKGDNTYEAVARRWMASNVQWSEGYAAQVKRTMEKDVFPKVGKLPISSVRTAHLRPLSPGRCRAWCRHCGDPDQAMV